MRSTGLKYHFMLSLSFILFIIALSIVPGYCQFPFPQPFPPNAQFFPNPFSFGLPGFPASPYFTMPPQNASKNIQITREFYPGQFTYENISLYLKSDKPLSVLTGVISKSGQMFWIEGIPENSGQKYSLQNNKIVVFLGSEKLDGKWHEWEFGSINDLLSVIGNSYDFIATLEIQGNSFCIGPIISFLKDENGYRDISYLESFLDERDTIEDYGWKSSRPVKVEYNFPLEDKEEGYLCLSSQDQTTMQPQLPKTPITFLSYPQAGLGPLLPVTVFTQTPLSAPAPIFNPLLQSIYRVVASQLYSTPINPLLTLGLIQSIPLYLDAQSGTPYSVRQNISQSSTNLSGYPTGIDYNDPAYAYLGLN